MSTVHRTLNGGWAECTDEACTLKFHFPDITVTEAKAMPLKVLLPLLEVFDPPSVIEVTGRKIWIDGYRPNADYRYHRDYDLPAIIRPNGELQWWQNGQPHRYRGPAILRPNGGFTYYVHGKLVEWR